MAKIHKALIPAAGWGTRMAPITTYLPKEMLPLAANPAIYYAVQEAIFLGINDICVITAKWKKMLKEYLVRTFPKIKFTFIYQDKQNGLGDAVSCGKKWAKKDSFLLIMPDNFFNDFSFMKRFIDTYRNGCLLLTFKGTEQDMGKYSVLESETENKEYLKIIQILEKPLPRDTKSRLIGYWRAIIDCEIFSLLKQVEPGKNGEIQLTDAFALMAKQGKLFAYNSGIKFPDLKFLDIGNKKDYASANDYFTNFYKHKINN